MIETWTINTHMASDQPLIQGRSKATIDVLMTIILKFVARKFPQNKCQRHKTSSYNSLANSAYVVAKVHSEEEGWIEYKVHSMPNPKEENIGSRCLNISENVIAVEISMYSEILMHLKMFVLDATIRKILRFHQLYLRLKNQTTYATNVTICWKTWTNHYVVLNRRCR